MCPNVDTFVVHHEKTFEKTSWSVKIDAIAVCYLSVILHKLRSFFVIADKMMVTLVAICSKVFVILMLLRLFLCF